MFLVVVIVGGGGDDGDGSGGGGGDGGGDVFVKLRLDIFKEGKERNMRKALMKT